MRTQSLDKPRSASLLRQPAWRVPPALASYSLALAQRIGLPEAMDGSPPAIGFTSCTARAGVSTLAAGLAAVVAGSGRDVLLVEAASHNPGLARRFGVAPSPGFWDMLAGQCSAMELSPTDPGNLCLLPCGKPPSKPLLAGRETFAQLLKQWRECFDLIVLDLPPAMPEEPLVAWTSALDGVLLVIQSERTVAEDAKRVKQTLEDCQARLLGAVLNQHRSYLPRWLA